MADAGELLGVTAQRVSQMLSAGKLSGPHYPHKRVPKHAVRVWKWSLDQELARRQSTPSPRSAHHQPDPAADRDVFAQWWERQEARVNAAAHELKVAADLARQQASEDRKKARQLMSKLARVTIQQAELIEQLKDDLAVDTERTERILDAYSDALTQLLAPDTIGPL
ncbi:MULTISPECIES: hypothetical protein [Mycobacterium simiae complex]|uniref:hypothetical protein n=1 Tax=Mycobacterium simiae complex TaxID=2249310 RepID=UPI001FD4F57E|nr:MULTISPECIES: hypothetical protein [Mycobacterium simiae complex]